VVKICYLPVAVVQSRGSLVGRPALLEAYGAGEAKDARQEDPTCNGKRSERLVCGRQLIVVLF
jgi:hypothetical protein